jgi:hypothetical protein
VTLLSHHKPARAHGPSQLLLYLARPSLILRPFINVGQRLTAASDISRLDRNQGADALGRESA